MMRSKMVGAIATGAVLSLGLTACGDDSGGGAAVEENALDGVSIAVGSKDFTENILLGEMFAQALEGAGADVDAKINLGGTEVNRGALLSGDVDVYPEYNGTGWTVHLEQEEPSSDPEELQTKVSEKDLADNQIQWIGQSPFNDTYGFASNGDLTESDGPFDLQGMADYLEANPDATVCMESEFPNRPDGLILFEDETGYKVPRSQINILETGLIYTETEKGSCDFGEIFTTDGRLTELNIDLVEDPGAFILYNISFTMRDEVYQENAETYDEIANAILEPLDEETIQNLNAEVDIQGKPAATVAEDYLKEQGLI